MLPYESFRRKWRVITCSRQAFDPKCPWPGGEDNHVQVDLSNPNNTLEAIDEVKKGLMVNCTHL